MNSSDTYKVLGVSPSDSDEKIKAAYKELVKKYHPDQYQDNPLSDVAAEKMADVNAAYDQIMNERRNGGSSSGYSGNSYGFDNNRVRSLIQSGNITQAEQILESVSASSRNAEWYFLKGSVCYKRGWLNEAYTNFQMAYSMNPSNMEYESALKRMNMSRGGNMNGSPYQNNYSNVGQGMDCCASLCCADCCCECMGGDLIPCC